MPPSPSAVEGSSTILIVEDDLSTNRALCDALSSQYVVKSATNGSDGLKMASELKPDLIVTDLAMPGLTGQDLIRRLHQEPGLEQVPIVVLTADADDALRLKLLQSGAQDYLTKPFSIAELRARIANLVAMKHARDVLEAELQSKGLDLASLAREVALRKRELQETLQSIRLGRKEALAASKKKSRLLGIVSHELRTPLTALQLQVQRLERGRDGPITDDQRAVLHRMSVFASRLTNLFESLLHCTKIEAGRFTATLVSFDLRSLAADVLEEVRSQAEEKGLAVRLVTPSDLPPLQSDPQLVRLILANLLSNAVKFTERGSVELELCFDRGTHQIEVTDTGPGIAIADRMLIYEPFEQLGRSKSSPGVGLGLALAKEMAAVLGGEIHLDSELGRGSTFTVSIPSIRAKNVRARVRRSHDAHLDCRG